MNIAGKPVFMAKNSFWNIFSQALFLHSPNSFGVRLGYGVTVALQILILSV